MITAVLNLESFFIDRSLIRVFRQLFSFLFQFQPSNCDNCNSCKYAKKLRSIFHFSLTFCMIAILRKIKSFIHFIWSVWLIFCMKLSCQFLLMWIQLFGIFLSLSLILKVEIVEFFATLSNTSKFCGLHRYCSQGKKRCLMHEVTQGRVLLEF